jgi:hypothetical protein
MLTYVFVLHFPMNLPGLPPVRRDGPRRYAHYVEQIGRASEGRGGVGRGAFQFQFSKPRRKIIILIGIQHQQPIYHGG